MTTKQSLLLQLKARGADVTVFRKLVADYCWFDQQLQAMKRDIRERGRTYQAISSQGKEYEKDNPSVANALRYSQQMCKILAQLGLTVDTAVEEAPEAEDL